MTMPKAYDPVYGQKYQILTRYLAGGDRAWEHCDYAKDRQEKNNLLGEYRSAYGGGFDFKVIPLPQKYWQEEAKQQEEKAIQEIRETLNQIGGRG